MSHDITQDSFLADIATHSMHVLRDDGVYRHLRFKRPDSGTMHFDLVTWPGHLAYTGDMGSYVFARLDDMFEFFRTDRRFGESQGHQLFINPGYWGEKVSAVDADYVYEQGKSGRLEEFSVEKFRRELIGHLVEWLRDFRAETTKGERRRLWNAVMDELIHPLRVIAPGWGGSMLDAAIRFSHPVNDFVGIYSPGDHLMNVSVTGFTRRFIWACYAIAWGVSRYDEEKEKAEANPAGHGEALPDEIQPIDSVVECAAIGLESAGFGGLYIPGICGCKLSELSPCICINSECTPGYLHEHSTDKTRWVMANQKKPMTDKEIEEFQDE